MKKLRVFLIGTIALVTTSFIVYKSYPKNSGSEYEFSEGYIPDAFEYYLPAANLFLHNKFPYYGFISPMESYRLHPHPDSIKYFKDTYNAGCIVFVSKPPMYSLLLGLTYKLVGFTSIAIPLINFICVFIIVYCIILFGYIVQGWIGFFFSIVIAFVWFNYFCPPLFNCDADILTTCLSTMFVLVGSLAFKGKKVIYFCLAGTILGLLLLTKGLFIFVLPFTGVVLLRNVILKKTINTLFNFVGFSFFVFLPLFVWMLYINPLLQSDISNRLAFAQKLEASTPQISVAEYKQLYNNKGEPRQEVIEHLNKFHQYQHARENGFVFISNQIGKYNILNVHNEYCTDGDFHPEWRIVQSSFYNSCINDPNIVKLFKFYTAFPALGVQITWAKITHLKDNTAWLFYAVLLLMLFLFCRGQLPEACFPAFFVLSSVFLCLVIFYGDIRFIHTIVPVAFIMLATILKLVVGRRSRI